MVLSGLLTSACCLTELDLRKNDIRPEGGTAIAGSLQQCRHLQSLSLRQNPIGSLGATALAAALRATEAPLAALDLGYCALGAAGATAIAPRLGRGRGPLANLDLGGNGIGPPGAASITSAILRCGSGGGFGGEGDSRGGLSSISLHNNNLGDAGMALILDGLPGLRLDVLDVGCNGISPSTGEAGLPHFEFNCITGKSSHRFLRIICSNSGSTVRELDRAAAQIGLEEGGGSAFGAGRTAAGSGGGGWIGGAERRLEAFCMGLHPRLGARSEVLRLDTALVDALLCAYVAPRRCVILY